MKTREILSQILHGCVSSPIRRKALKDNLNLKQVLDEACALELSESRAAEMENQINAVSSKLQKHCGVSSGKFSHSKADRESEKCSACGRNSQTSIKKRNYNSGH